ncbi:unnamed protein product, partial [Choristocarpus tenellus]
MRVLRNFLLFLGALVLTLLGLRYGEEQKWSSSVHPKRDVPSLPKKAWRALHRSFCRVSGCCEEYEGIISTISQKSTNLEHQVFLQNMVLGAAFVLFVSMQTSLTKAQTTLIGTETRLKEMEEDVDRKHGLLEESVAYIHQHCINDGELWCRLMDEMGEAQVVGTNTNV